MGTRMAVYLSHRGEKVTLIDRDKGRCEWVSKHSDAVVYNGNVLDPALLVQAEIMKADSLIVTLGNDQTVRELVRLAKFQFGVPKVIAIVKDSAIKEKIQKYGAEEVVCAEDTVLNEIKALVHGKGDRVLYHDGVRDYKIEQVAVSATSRMLGKEVSTLENKFARAAGVLRGGILLFPGNGMELQMGDEVIVIGSETGVSEVCARIEG